MRDSRQINVIGNIYNNIIKGINDGKTLISLQGGTRSGKTYNVMIYLIMECLQHPIVEKITQTSVGEVKTHESLTIGVVRRALPDIKQTVLKDFREIMEAMGQWEERRFNKTENIYTFRNGAVMRFRAFDDEQKARGFKNHILFCNEANELKFDVFKQLRRRVTKYTIIDYNPTFTSEHWIFEENASPRTYHFKSTYLDNVFLEQSVIDEVLSLKDLHPELWQVYGLGEFAIISGLVFPEENWDVIEDDDFPIWASDGFIGLDWGWEPDPTVAVHVIIEDNEIYVRELFRENKLFAEDIADRLEEYSGIQKYCDIDKRLIADLEREGIPMLKATEKDRSTIMTGIHIMNQRKIHITESSTGLLKEFRNYVYKKDRNGVIHTDANPVDKFNHGIDALRYVCLEEFDTERKNKYEEYEFSKEDLGFPI